MPPCCGWREPSTRLGDARKAIDLYETLAKELRISADDVKNYLTRAREEYRKIAERRVRLGLVLAEIGKRAGLRFVYAGNLPGRVGDWENTRCAECHALLVERYGYLITGYHLTADGACPLCAAKIPGRWARQFEGQITARPMAPRGRSASNAFRIVS